MPDKSPKYLNDIKNMWNVGTEVEFIDHSELKQINKCIKAILRTGEFSSFGNLILVSGAGYSWYVEKNEK
jgi:D-ribose pyranase